MGLDIIKRMKEVRKEQIEGKKRVIEIPELGTDENPLRVSIYPLSVEEMRMILDPQLSNTERMVKTIIWRMRNEDGRRMFNPSIASEEREILRYMDPALMIRVVNDINTDIPAIVNATPADAGN